MGDADLKSQVFLRQFSFNLSFLNKDKSSDVHLSKLYMERIDFDQNNESECTVVVLICQMYRLLLRHTTNFKTNCLIIVAADVSTCKAKTSPEKY